ncbi:MAG TPA: branched-chain amino acid ABC transporter substrate-binding protein [Methylomirabilota bacterium]|nr:branched-chain amino acid ABC transporter substrate-binding protein [Methylomirabilota bacterium]
MRVPQLSRPELPGLPGARLRPGALPPAVAGLVVLLGWLSWAGAAFAPPSALRIGVSLSVTGPDAQWGIGIHRGVELAVEDVNRGGGAGGHRLEVLLLDSAGSGALGQRVRANYQQFVADPLVIAVVGPQTSVDGRAVAALLSRANLATITPSSTTFDITDPALRGHFRPGGRAVYFRTVGTDVTQGDAMARFAHARLRVRRVILIDDGLPFGMRAVDTFARRAAALGITVLDRWQLNWIQADYREQLRRLGALGPDAIYAGVRYQVGVKLARQIPRALPSAKLLGPDTLYNRAFPVQARSAGAEGWYVSNVAPHPAATAAAAAWAERFRARFAAAPSSYSLTGYAAVAVIADAVTRVVARGIPVTRANVRDAIEATRLPDALPGPISFDPDGDLERPAVSIYQVRSGEFQHVETVLPAGVKGAPAAEAWR